MRHPDRDVVVAEAMLGEKPVDVPAQMLAHHLRDLGAQHDLEAARAHAPAHDVFRARIEHAARADHLGTGASTLGAGEHHGRRAIAEEPARDEVGHGEVVALERQRAELDGEEHGDLAGMTDQIVGGPGDTRGARHAAEPEDGNALEVGSEAETVDEARVEARHGKPRHARRPQRVDVADAEPGSAQGVLDGGGPQVGADADPRVVGFREIHQARIALQRKGQMPAADERMTVELLDAGDVVVAGGPRLAERCDQRLLVDVVRREGAADGRDAHPGLSC